MISALRSAKLKLIRASEHIKAIERCIRGYRRRKPYKLIGDPHSETTLDIRKPPPEDIATLAGEVLYQLRSALDHLAFDLVKLNRTGIVLPHTWEEDCNFPLRFKLPKGVTKPPVAQKHFTDALPGITKSAFAFIESVQPYYRTGTPEIMGWLAHLSNIDKHRHLNLTVTNVTHREVLRLNRGWTSHARSGLQHGAKIKSPFTKPEQRMNVKSTVSAYVTFKEVSIGKASDVAVEYLLQLFSNTIEAEIIPAFDQFLN